MSDVIRLVTTVDDDDRRSEGNRAGRRVSVSALHEAELENGTRVVLLDDRGWASSGEWSRATFREIIDTSRTVVGPDEPYGGATAEDAATGHWNYLSEVLARAGISIDAAELGRLPHDVVLTQRLSDRLKEH